MIKKFICLLFFCSCIIVIPQTISSAEAYEINQKSAFKSEKPLAQLFGVMLGALSSTASNEQRRPIDDPIAYCQGNGRCFDHRGRVVVPENQNVPTYYDNRGGYNTQPVNAGYPSSGGRAVYCQNGRCFDDRGNVVSQGNQNMRVQQLRPSVQYTAPQSYPQRPAQRRQSYDKSELYCDMISGVCQLMATNEKITGTVKEYNEDNGTTFETYYLNGYPDTLKKYDKYGNLIKFIKLENNKITISQSYYPTGVIKTEEKWGYSGNPMNNPPLEEIIFYDEKGDMECHVSERLNCSLGEMISSCSSSSGKLVWKKISDEKNDVVSETIYRCGIKKRYVDGVLVEEVKGEISPENNSDNYVDAVVREYYAPDVLKSEERYKNNKKDGLAKYYDERGILIKAIKYKDGQADEQLAVYRDEKGHYGTEAEYEQAHYTGVLRRYNAAGKIEEENTYTNGILDGVCKLYYESGNLKAEMTFKNGKEAAPLKSYYETGELKSEIAFQNGTENGPAKYYTHSGALKIEMNFKDGKPEGVSKKYYDTGNLHLEANFVRGVENGSMKTYYETGGLQSDINFKDGVEDGPAKYYDEQGNLTKAVNYQNGQEGEILTIYQDDNGRYGVEPEYEQAHYTGTLKKYGADDVLESEKVYVGGLLNGLSKTYYKNGSIQTEVNFKNGVENGIAKYYDEEGNIMKAANYENGQVGDWLPIYQDDDGQYGTETEYMEAGYTGVLKKYGSDGKLESYKTYLNGVLDGLTQTYYETGQIKSKINFKNGKEDGIVKSYYQSGAIRGKVNFKDGKEDGVSKYYYESGELESEADFKNGVKDGIAKFYYESGALKSEENWKNNQKNGVAKSYSKSGKLQSEVGFKDDKKDGMTKIYYESGALEEEINYVAGKENGLAKYYYSSGALDRLVNYTNGKKNGVQKSYYTSGALRAEANFVNGEEDGVTKEYYERGGLKSATPYKGDFREGTAKTYYENGALKSETTYHRNQKYGTEKTYYESGALATEDTFENGKQVGKTKKYEVALAIPQDEKTFININQEYFRKLWKAKNDLQIRLLRKKRAESFKQWGFNGKVVHWKGQVASLSTLRDNVSVDIRISNIVTLSILTDINDPLIERLADLKTDDVVDISGSIVRDSDVYFKERSITTIGGLSNPEYRFNLDSLNKYPEGVFLADVVPEVIRGWVAQMGVPRVGEIAICLVPLICDTISQQGGFTSDTIKKIHRGGSEGMSASLGIINDTLHSNMDNLTNICLGQGD